MFKDQEWIASLDKSGKSENTISSYGYRLDIFAHWFKEQYQDGLKSTKVTPADLLDFKKYLLDQECQKPSTVNLSFFAIQSWFNFHKVFMPVPKSIKTLKSSQMVLSEQAIHALLQTIERGGKVRDLAIVRLLLDTGLKVSELCALTVQEVIISSEINRLEITGKRQRDIPLTKNAVIVLKTIIGQRTEGSLILREKSYDKSGLLPSAVQQLIAQYSWQAGLKNVYPRVLQNTFEQRLLDKGVDPLIIRTLLGRESPVMPINCIPPGYLRLRQAVAKLND